MIGNIGLGKRRPFDDGADGQLARPQGFQDFQARRIAKAAKEPRFDIQGCGFGREEHGFLAFCIIS